MTGGNYIAMNKISGWQILPAALKSPGVFSLWQEFLLSFHFTIPCPEKQNGQGTLKSPYHIRLICLLTSIVTHIKFWQ